VKYLYLFKHLKQEQVKNQFIHLNILTVGDEKYLYLIGTSSKKSIEQLQKDAQSSTGLSAVAGMDKLKYQLIQEIVEPIRNPEQYEKFGISLPNGILLFGPPGCGKTYIVNKLAEEVHYSYFNIKHSDLASSYIHGTTKIIGEIFEKAKENAPSIVFIDEIEALAPKRTHLTGNSEYRHEEINELLMQFNESSKNNVIIVCATNFPQLIDDALMRPGRLDKLVYVPPPDIIAREELFIMYFANRPTKSIDFFELAVKTFDYSSVDIELICNESARNAMQDGHDAITQFDVEQAISRIPSSLVNIDFDMYNELEKIQRF
jgi:transitional endoplasmic reticulum ATPase